MAAVSPHKSKCHHCTKRLLPHKVHLKCSLCENDFHPKCSKLTPSDVNLLNDTNYHQFWTCSNCTYNIFPLHETNLNDCHDKSRKLAKNRTIKYCHTFSKQGIKFITCDFCGNQSHPRCSAGQLGCKACAADIFPGYYCNVNELFPKTYYNSNNLVFDPYDVSHDVNNIGNIDREFGNVDQDTWSTYSEILQRCSYHRMEKISASRSGELKVLTLNVRSLNDKIATIRDDLENYSKFDILCFNETWCSIEQLPFGGDELKLEAFHVPIIQSPARKSGRGGGLVIYINKQLCSADDYKILENLSDNSNYLNGEFLFIEITQNKSKNIIIGNMYRSPCRECKPTLFIDKLEQKLDLLTRHKNKQIVLVSDSNIDLLKYKHHEPTNKLVNLLTEHGFSPTISRPTRITTHSATLIDHIFVNNCAAVTKSGIVTIDISDHLAPFVSILIDSQKRQAFENDSFTWRQINDENLENFRLKILSTDWSSVENADSADEKYGIFESKYREIYEHCFPARVSKNRKRKTDQPWLLPWLQGACDRKNKLHKKFVKKPSIENETQYKKLKNFCAKHVKKAKYAYYSNYFRRYADDGRKQWQMINQILNRKPKSKPKITKLAHDDTVVTSPKDVANCFNNFFCNVAQRLKDGAQSHLGPGDRSRPPESYLNTSQRNLISMAYTECTLVEIEKYISSLKNKATSDLAIQPLKFVCKEIAPIIQHLVSSSLVQGIFPDLLKCAKVIPLHKSGSRSLASNYRPISLLSCFSKIYERAMHKRLTEFLNQNKLLFESQYGFRAMHSCEHALLEAQYNLNMALDKKQIAALLLIDFSKAFDMVDHGILLNKLEHYGIRGHLLDWFRSYLIGRQQYVHVNNENSVKHGLKYCVPQGSILGPVLFILYINDLPNISNLANYIFFADDANIIITGFSTREIREKVESVLTEINSWVTANGLKLNLKKTKFMIFSNKHNISTSDINITFNGVSIERVESERFLGVILDSDLSWKSHISGIAAKVSRNAGILFKLKGLVPEKVLKLVYNSLIQSHLNYCSNIWGLGSKSSIEKIFRAQKKAIRTVENKFNNCFYNKETGELPCHTKEIFSRNKLLTVHNLIAKNCLVAMHKIYLGVSPVKIRNLFEPNLIPNYSTRRQPSYFATKFSRLTASDKTLPFKGVKLYNQVVNKINIIHTSVKLERKFPNSFKGSVSKYLIDEQGSGGVEWEDNKNFVLYSTPGDGR